MAVIDSSNRSATVPSTPSLSFPLLSFTRRVCEICHNPSHTSAKCPAHEYLAHYAPLRARPENQLTGPNPTVLGGRPDRDNHSGASTTDADLFVFIRLQDSHAREGHASCSRRKNPSTEEPGRIFYRNKLDPLCSAMNALLFDVLPCHMARLRIHDLIRGPLRSVSVLNNQCGIAPIVAKVIPKLITDIHCGSACACW